MGESQVILGLLTTSAVLTLHLNNFGSNPYSKASYVTSACIQQLYTKSLITALK